MYKCKDSDEARMLMTERAVLSEDSSTCARAIMEYRLKEICAHKYFIAQDPKAWWRGTSLFYELDKRHGLIKWGGKSAILLVLRIVFNSLMIPFLVVAPFSDKVKGWLRIKDSEFNSNLFKMFNTTLWFGVFLAIVSAASLSRSVRWAI